MKRTFHVKQIHWNDQFLMSQDGPVYLGVDGAIEYELITTRTTEEIEEQKNEYWTGNPWELSFYQPFSAKGQIQVNGRNVWKWDGNREAPTLTPSWLCDMSYGKGKNIRIHLLFTRGKIALLGDSNVEASL